MSTCTVCTSRSLPAIDGALRQGDNMSAIARRFGVSRYAVSRHRDAHTFDPVAAGETGPATIDTRLLQIEAALAQALESAQRGGRMQGVVAASRELTKTLEVLHRLRIDERAERARIELTPDENMRAVRQALVETIGPRHPEYLEDFERRLEQVLTADLERKVRNALAPAGRSQPFDHYD